MRPGDLAELKIGVPIEAKGVWIPLSALSETVRGLWSVYTIDENGQAQQKVAEILYQNQNSAFIRSNLSQGETVVTKGVHRLVPGQKLKALP